MRAIPTGGLRNSVCGLCKTPVTEEEHRAGDREQRVTWWVPVPHAAGCGRPCIAGGVEADRSASPPSFAHAHRADRCGADDCRGGASYLLPGLRNPVAWRAHLSDGSSRVFEVCLYLGPNTSKSWFASYGDGWTPDSLRARSTESEVVAARTLAAQGGWSVERFDRDVTGYPTQEPGNVSATHGTAQTRAAEILRGMRRAPRMYGASSADLAAFAQGVLAVSAAASASAHAWTEALRVVLEHDVAREPVWASFSLEEVVRVAEHAARRLGIPIAPDAAPQLATPSRRYRLVMFLADPFTGAQFPVGAIVETEGVARFIEAPRMPDEAYLGAEVARLLALVLLGLRSVKTLRPRSIAPTVVCGVIREIPASVEADAWVAAHLAGGERA